MQQDALRYHDLGFKLVKLAHGDKKPVVGGWQKKEYTREEVAREFANGANIGLRCGDNGLVDVDVDDPRARRLAVHFLPSTPMVHGRAGAQGSHHWFVVDPVPPKRLIWEDPVSNTVLVELRSTGGQTMVPPSIHPSGEPLQWEYPTLEPTALPAPVLQQAVARLAACALLARHWPAEGVRHQLALAVGSVLLRYVYQHDEDSAAEFVYLAATFGGDEEAEADRVRAVRDTRNTLIRGGHATGIPTMKRYLPEGVVQKFCEWLNIEGWDDPKASRLIFQVQSTPPNEIDDDEWRRIVDEIEIPVADMPYYLHRLYQHVQPLTNMFSPDWALMIALGYWSCLWPGIRLQNLGLNLWVLGIAEQGSGKNVGTDALSDLFLPLRKQRGIMHFTSGTPQGLWNKLSGDDKAIMCYHDEFVGFLKSMNSDYNANLREAMCSLYDGRIVSHSLAKGEVEIHHPHVSVVATTTLAAVQEFGRSEDLSNGYLTRFMIYANDYTRTRPELRYQEAAARDALGAEIAAHLDRFPHLERVAFESSGAGDPAALLEYEEHLGANSGEVRKLEDQADANAIPPGRLLARAKKLAALYELAERHPQLTPDGKVALIRDQHVETAIDLVQRSHAYTLRLWAQIGVPTDNRMVEHIRRLLGKHRYDGRTLRQITQSKAGKKLPVLEVNQTLDMLIKHGEVTRTETEAGVVFRLK